MRAVFDTNIYISAFAIPGGDAELAFLHAVRGTFELITSVPILAETARVLQTKFDWSEEQVRRLLEVMGQAATVVKPHPRLHVLQDEPDNRILECALVAQADFIVTGDRHLLSLRRYEGVEVIKLVDFLARLEGRPASGPSA